MKEYLHFDRVLFLGVGGVSMHQLAIATAKFGIKVFGYDLKRTDYTAMCEKNGILITNRFKKEFCEVDLCVKNGAINEDNRYVKEMKKRGVHIIDRADLLAIFCGFFKTVIAVAGTHGKTTTASLIYSMLRRAGKRVSCHIGGNVEDARFVPGDDFLVVEACEYNKSFLKLHPTVCAITNIEKEHMDCYQNMFNLHNAFVKFIKNSGTKFVFDDVSTRFLKKYKNINFVSIYQGELSPILQGAYNLKNISLAIAVATHLGIEKKDAVFVANNFEGVPRRFEQIGYCGEQKIFVDYAHHPTEINAFISTFCLGDENRTIVFQPHTYSRTKLLLNKFLEVLKRVKNLIIYKEYPAREKESCGMSAYALFTLLSKQNPSVKYCANLTQLNKMLPKNSDVAFVGAGDIYEVAKKIVASYKKNG